MVLVPDGWIGISNRDYGEKQKFVSGGLMSYLDKFVQHKETELILIKYSSIKDIPFMDRKDIEEIQRKKLAALLLHAYRNTCYYKELFDRASFNPESCSGPGDINKIPPLTREILNNRFNDLIASNIPRNGIHLDGTGGSTGMPTRFARDNECLDIKRASEFRFNSWTGWHPPEKILYYWSPIRDFGSRKWISSLDPLRYLRPELRVYAGKLNDKLMSEHLKIITRYRPALLRAFPNTLQIFAEYLERCKVQCRIKNGIICVGESINDFQRDLFERVFSAKVFNCYVSRECGNMACECNSHTGLHVAEDMIMLEVDNPDPGGTGEILLTDLENYGMPLIRYRIQDASRWVAGECPCGMRFRRIDLNSARLADFLVSPIDGSMIGGVTLIHYLLAVGPIVGRFQIVQDQLDHVTVRMARSEEKNEEAKNHIRKTLNRIFEGKMRQDIEYLDEIPFLSSGKYQFIRNEIKKAQN
jgi:phenylacetate-CoA ligase